MQAELARGPGMLCSMPRSVDQRHLDRQPCQLLTKRTALVVKAQSVQAGHMHLARCIKYKEQIASVRSMSMLLQQIQMASLGHKPAF